MAFQAGGPDGSPNALAVSGRWVAAMTAARLAGRPVAKHPGTRFGLMQRSTSPDGAPGQGTGVEVPGGIAQARSGHRGGEMADSIALIRNEGVHVHQRLDLGNTDRGVGDDRLAVGVPDQDDRLPLEGRVLGQELVQVGGVLRQAAQRIGRRVYGEAKDLQLTDDPAPSD
jgi:hypothetical protein